MRKNHLHETVGFEIVCLRDFAGKADELAQSYFNRVDSSRTDEQNAEAMERGEYHLGRAEAYRDAAERMSRMYDRESIRQAGQSINIRRKDGEYRVPGADRTEDSAYYTDGLEDAIATAKKIHGEGSIIRLNGKQIMEG